MDVNFVSNEFLEILEGKRGHATGVKNTKRKRLNVPPGQGITVADLEQAEEEKVDDPEPIVPVKRPRGRPSKKHAEETAGYTSADKSSCVSDLTSSSSDESTSSSSDEADSEVEDGSNPGPSSSTPAASLSTQSQYCVEDYVLAFYTGDGSYYPGRILSVTPVAITVRCMERYGNSWRWPAKHDDLRCEVRHISRKITPPQRKSKRNGNLFSVPELSAFI